MNEAEDYHLLKEGDLVRMVNFADCTAVGIVVEIGRYGNVHIFWPEVGKTTKSGKKWAELHFELLYDEQL